MPLVEQQRSDRHATRWQASDAATFARKTLDTAALSVQGQASLQASLFEHQRVIADQDLDRLMQATAAYRALPANVAQWVVQQVCAAWESDVAARAAWHLHPETVTGPPHGPHTWTKTDATCLPTPSKPSAASRRRRAGSCPRARPIRVAPTTTHPTHAELAQVRFVPRSTHYVVAVV